jgi:hypothetical protein
MIFIVTLLSLLFLPILSFKEITPKICINCKYFISNNNNNNKFSKCSLFPKEDNYILVNGIHEDKEYHYCSTSRRIDEMCGKEGKLYKKKYKKRILNEKISNKSNLTNEHVKE